MKHMNSRKKFMWKEYCKKLWLKYTIGDLYKIFKKVTISIKLIKHNFNHKLLW